MLESLGPSKMAMGRRPIFKNGDAIVFNGADLAFAASEPERTVVTVGGRCAASELLHSSALLSFLLMRWRCLPKFCVSRLRDLQSRGFTLCFAFSGFADVWSS